MKKNLIKICIILIVVASFGYYFTFSAINSTNTKDYIFHIVEGSSVQEIAHHLKEAQFIKNETAFRIYTRLSGLDKKFSAGSFNINQSMNVTEIAEVLTGDDKITVKVTILEGQSSKQIDNKLANINLIKEGEFTQALKDFDQYSLFPFIPETTNKNLTIPLEGYLFPDTYFIDPANFDSEEFIITMINNFEKKALPTIQENSTRPIHEVLTMASIIDEEAHGLTDAKIISDILWKRVDSGWFLGADATSLYLKDSRDITAQTLQEQNPYNTRKFQKGLPPGPIGNPGLISIQAATTPQPTEYWYYLHDNSGTPHYSTSDPEHNAKVQKYLR